MPDVTLDLDRPAHEHAARLRAGDYTARALAEATLRRVRDQEPRLNAYITITDELALAQAEAADERLRSGDAAPLTGIPVAIKDLLSVVGVETTAGFKPALERALKVTQNEGRPAVLDVLTDKENISIGTTLTDLRAAASR